MSEKSYAFAVASVRAKENDLLQASFMAQLVDSDYENCVRQLADKGIIPHDCDDAINALSDYMVSTWDFLESIAPDMSIIDFMTVKNDFHNLKAILKSMVTNSNHSEFFMSPCVADPAEMYGYIKEKQYEFLPEWIRESAKHGYELITSTMDGQLLDIYIDCQSLVAMRKFAAETKCDFAVELADLQTALTDIKVALRLSRSAKSDALLDEAFCENNIFDIQLLKTAVSKSTADVIEFIGTTQFKELAESLANSKAEFERECDNLLIEKLDDSRNCIMSAEPLIAYYYAKENECRMLRIILSCKHIGLEKAKIEERMRELYV